MKPVTLLLILFAFLSSAYGQQKPQPVPESLLEYDARTLYVQLAPGHTWGSAELTAATDSRLSGFPEIAALFQSGAITVIRQEFKVAARKDEAIGRIYRVQLADGQSPATIVSRLIGLSGFGFVERIPLYRTFLTPNDPAFSDPLKRWHLDQINAPEAWDITQGNPYKTIAIVDDAVLTSHEDLALSITYNTGEMPGNGIDDDGNGYIDDPYGYDVADGDPNVNPPASVTDDFFTHGTLVAGVAAARTNNNLGASGIGFNALILPVKTKSDNELTPGLLTNPMHGVEYAIASGAEVINMSWGSYASSQAHQLLMNLAFSEGLVTVAATGNQGLNYLMYPAGYENVIAVAASGQTNDGASFSNVTLGVTVFAPGVDIWSCLADANNSYGYASGTSLAAPMVSAVAALMLSNTPTFTPEGVRNCIQNSASQYPSTLWPGLTIAVLDAEAAVSCPIPFANVCTPEGCELIANGGFEEPSNSGIVSYGNFGWAAVSEGQVCSWDSYQGTADVFPNPVAGFDNYAGLYFSYSPTPGWEYYAEGLVTQELPLIAGQEYVLEFDASIAGFDMPVDLDSLCIGLMSNTFVNDDGMTTPSPTYPTHQLGAVYNMPVDTLLTVFDQPLIMDGTIQMSEFFHHHTVTFTMPAITGMDRLVLYPRQTFQGTGYTNQVYLDNFSLRAQLSVAAVANEDTIVQGECVNLSASGSGNSFVWEPEALFTDPVGATQLSCPDTTVAYIATVYDAVTGCTASDTVVVHVIPHPELGIADLSAGVVSVYPNPVVNELWIESTNTSAELTFGIYDCAGKIIGRGIIPPNQTTAVDCKHIAPGMYMLRIGNGQNVQLIRK